VIGVLLISNRGEIARRIARTANAMGIKSVAVYAEGDSDSPFVKEADRAVPLAGRTAAETYLNADAILAAAVSAGADAVHPGYGFLSERADFARSVIEAGLTWVGPPPDVIDVMGDKLAAKRIMAAAGVPVLRSWEISGDALPDDDGLPMPLLVKAAAGGGGKGMRVVEAVADLPEAVAAARREARAAFGDDTVFLERYLTSARHIEIQILADDHGGFLHCFERECSIQRRHQKIIEESPSPAIDNEQREHIGAAALAAAKAVGYRNAGTVEFVLEPSGDFWFLEVNTRLQVEHPVTEAVTGLDLVREQILVAQGHPLSVTQAELGVRGHAIEARLYAEDPVAGFLPSTGTLVDWCPAVDPAVRWDSGVEAGSVVGVEFDPMLAKVISHAPTRVEAALRLALALERSRIRGVTTNRDFLVATLHHPEFIAGHTTTDFIARTHVSLERSPSNEEVRVAAIGAALSAQEDTRREAPVLRSLPTGWRNSVMPPEKMTYHRGADEVEVLYRSQRDGTFEVSVGDWHGSVLLLDSRDGWIDFESVWTGELPGPVASETDRAPRRPSPPQRSRHRVHVLQHDHRVWVQGPDGDVALTARPRFPEAGTEADVAGGLVAPMPGKVVSVEVATGDAVAEGQLLMIVEAMKMEHRVTAPHAGVVVEVKSRAGDQVSGGELLVVIDS
jgi:propionyl-CoA carboxylase alpha chain